jgi:hypothetical protein
VEKSALLKYPKKARRVVMRKQTFSTAKDLVSIRVPKKLAGKKVMLVDAAEYAALKAPARQGQRRAEENIARRCCL